MEITVKLFGVFRIERFKQSKLSMMDGCKAQAIIDQLQIPSTLLDIVLVNGVHADAEHVLQDGDILTLLPLLEGG